MCLYTGRNTLMVAEYDIPCYKCLIYRPKYGIYKSPCYGMNYTQYVTGTTDEERTVRTNGNVAIKKTDQFNFIGAFEINGGAVHTFSSMESARRFIKADIYVGYDDKAMLFRCTIPKGTEYAEGRDTYGMKGYASKALRLGEGKSVRIGAWR